MAEYEQMRLFEKDPNENRKEYVANAFRVLGAHSESIREENDFYATDPLATVLLCEKEKFSSTVWEPCVGKGHIAEVLKQQGYKVVCSDIIDRGYPETQIQDFLCVQMNGGGGEPKRHYYQPTIQNGNKLCTKSIGHICERRKDCDVLENSIFGIARKMGVV